MRKKQPAARLGYPRLERKSTVPLVSSKSPGDECGAQAWLRQKSQKGPSRERESRENRDLIIGKESKANAVYLRKQSKKSEEKGTKLKTGKRPSLGP